MSEQTKRRALAALSRNDLLLLGKAFQLSITQRMSMEELNAALGKSGHDKLAEILPELPDASLVKIGRALGLSDEGSREGRMERILEATGEAKAKAPEKGLEPERAPEPATAATLSVPGAGEKGSVVEASPVDMAPPPGLNGGDLKLTVEVEPRKPRLAWQGMDRRERVVSVPTQVVEIVRPGRAMDRGDSLFNTDVRAAQPRTGSELPPNRLIWTNDNLVALATLLDERDPVTKDYRYRGKVDLIYIDPPFMVNSDFRADNAIDVDIDDEEGVQAVKEPSLVEILAYKDTWRQGLDSFLTMLRRRLELLKELLAPTGSIYVHLDWHAVHYVKVMMDELFGYENFKNEIVWRRTNARVAAGMWPRIHDTILVYGGNASTAIEAEFVNADVAKMPHTLITWKDGRKYQTFELTAPGTREGETGRPWRGFDPTPLGRHWANLHPVMDEWAESGLIHFPQGNGFPRRRGAEPFNPEDRLATVGDIWTDIDRLNQSAADRLGYPTQKPVALIERIVRASSPIGGIVLDCFVGSGTTSEAAERLGRKWIAIDNGKYAIHLTRKRLIQLHGQPRPPASLQVEHVKCDTCGNVRSKEKPQRSPGPFNVRPFTVENMGVYQRAEQWQDFQTQRSRYRDEMIKVFGGEPVHQSAHLHGRKGNSWIHVGPLDGPIASGQVWTIARDAQRTDRKAVIILSADFDTVSGSEKEAIQANHGVAVTIRVIPASAIEEVKRRIELLRAKPDVPIESMAIPAFYAPLSIVLSHKVSGKTVRVSLDRCEIDIDSFIASQRPLLKPITDSMTPTARKKAKAELEKWTAREKDLQKWLAKATTWQKFVDFWAVDSDYGHRVGTDGKAIFETEWQSFRTRKSKGETDPLVFTADLTYRQPGRYRVAARVTDVFGNDGIATIEVEVK